MYTLSVQSVKPGMVIYDDIFTPAGKLIMPANVSLTEEKIKLLNDYLVEEVNLAEPNEVDMTRYKHLHSHPHFQSFVEVYNSKLESFNKIMKNLNLGIDINTHKFLELRDDIMDAVHNSEQLLDYLYNMMPSENEITYNHCFNCGIICSVFGKWAGIEDEDLDNLTIAGFLFDIGKSKIPDELLWKPERLTPDEFIQMQRHIHLGYELLRTKQLPPHVITVLIMHHERCDGSGYPAHIKQNRIDPFALIAGIADTYEAMTHPRAQRLALTPFQAFRIFEAQGFAKFGPNIEPILKKIAAAYVDRRVCLSNNIVGRITEIHEDDLSRPTVFDGIAYHDLRETPELEIIRME